MPFELVDLGPALRDRDLNEMSQAIGGTLPEDYLSHVRQYNGGRCSHKHVFPLNAIDDHSSPVLREVRGFLVWKPSDEPDDWWYASQSLNSAIVAFREDDRFYPGLLAVAVGCGVNFCISLRPRDFGCVYLTSDEYDWDDDLKELAAPPPTFVAESFSSFLGQLRPHPNTVYLETEPPFRDAERGDWNEVRKYLLAGGNPHAVSPTGNSLLQLGFRSPTVVSLLLNAGLDVHRSDDEGRTALHHAVLGPSETVALLIEAGGDMDRADDHGVTPWTTASQFHGARRTLEKYR